MKICYIHRKQLAGRHSIENVFNTVELEIENLGQEALKIHHDGNILQTIKKIKSTNADIYHITGDVHYLSLFLPRNKTILTIHDIGAFKNNKKTIKRYIYFLLWFFLPIHYLKHVTAISSLTKNDLIKFTKVNPLKILVIPNPLSLPLNDKVKTLNEKLKILQIGSGQHKNLKNLILAVKNIDCDLIIVGKPGQLETELLSNNDISHQIYFNVSNSELNQIYNTIDILFFASFSEGFGLPILEAQILGIPIITSNISPMKEVSGGNAIFVNPYSIDDIRKAIVNISNNKENYKNMILHGKTNAANYKPKFIAKKYLELYKKIC